MCKEAPYGGELSFSEDSLRDMHNADLCDTLGNLVHRATNLCKKYCGGVVPDVPAPAKPPVDMAEVVKKYAAKMENFELEAGAAIAIAGFRDVNGYLTAEAPWLKKGDEHAEARQIAVRATLEAIYALTHLLTPFLTVGAAAIFKKLGTEPVSLGALGKDCRNLAVGAEVQVGGVLYAKLVSAEEATAGEASKKKETHAEAQKRKKDKQKKLIAASSAGNGDADQPEFTKMEIRVGKIVKVWNHEEADKLLCEEIDLGEEGGGLRQITSGLKGHYTLEEMQDKKVLVVCNLKASKIVGFVSNGMVLAAKADGKVELVTPPEDAKIGERVFIAGLTGDPASSAQVKKKKIWDNVAKELKTTEGGVATWDGKVIETSAGKCVAATLVGAPIS
jgi:methionine--tRNA ligase beta chain